MTLVLSPPEWKAVNKYYHIKFSWDPTSEIGVLSDTSLDNTALGPILTDDGAKELVDTVIKSLLDQGKRWFAKPLTETGIRNRLQHEIDNSSSSAQTPDPPFQTEWIPTSMRISHNQFVIVWSFKAFKEMKTQIPLSFMEDDDDEAGALREVDLEKAVVPNNDELFTLTEDEERRKSKERVKAARIKAAIAKYKAEVLVQEYEELYGDLSDNSDSDEEEDES